MFEAEAAYSQIERQNRELTWRLAHETRKDAYCCHVPAAMCLLTASCCSMIPAPAAMRANLLAPCPDLEAVAVTDMGDLLQACMDTNTQ